MTTTACSELFIGWDVGSWNCDKNPSSRDTLVVLDSQRKLTGEPWRGSLRRVINQSVGTDDFLLQIQTVRIQKVPDSLGYRGGLGGLGVQLSALFGPSARMSRVLN